MIDRHITLLVVVFSTAAVGACGLDTRRAGGSVGAQRFSESIRPRRFKDVEWKILWERGGTEADTVLLMPSELNTDGRYVYVYDMAVDRLLALRAADGSVAWTTGRRGSGPDEFRKAEDVSVRATGDLVLADPNNNRMTIVDREGAVTGHIPLDKVPYATSTCSLANGEELVSSLGLSPPPILRLSPRGEVLAQTYLPWSDAKDTPGIAQQGFFVRTHDGRCIYVLSLGRGFAIYEGTGFRPPVAFVESFDWPEVQLIPGQQGAPPSTRISDRREAARGAGVDQETIAIGFWGRTKDQGELIDVYSLDGGGYLNSFLAPVVFTRMTRADNVYFFETRRNGYPVLLAAEVREKVHGK